MRNIEIEIGGMGGEVGTFVFLLYPHTHLLSLEKLICLFLL